MSRESGDIAFAGRLLKRKVLLALTLSSLIPLLVLAYVVYRYVWPDLHPADIAKFYGLHALFLSTVLAMVGGAYIIWDLGRAFARIAELLSREPKLAELGGRSDEVGDETLRDVGQILMKHSRGINVVSRYGGDEFAVLLVETSKSGARLYADRIRQVVATFPYSHGKRVTASFGVASLPDDEASTSEELFRAADGALYAAKRAGKNQVVAAGPGQKVD